MSDAFRLRTAREIAEVRPLPGLTVEATARRWLLLAREGVIPAGAKVKLGRAVLFDLEKLDVWLLGGGGGVPDRGGREAA